jgi:hypothetical protein
MCVSINRVSAMPTYNGSCHCQAVRFEVVSVIDRVTLCNCTICTKKGILHHRVPPESFRLLSGEGLLATYQFGTLTAKHHFCRRCGIHVFTRPRSAPHLYTINVRVLDDFDLSQVETVPFDGRNWEQAVYQLK